MLVGVVSTAIALPAGSATAHPFGDPESAAISLITTDSVRVHWQVGMVDDYTYLAQSLDLLPEERTLLDGVVDARDGDPELVAASPKFTAYLLRHLGVTANGAACRGTVQPIEDLVADGVDVDFQCTGDVTRADVMISMLTDLSAYYTTLATGPEGQREAYNGSQTSYSWSFDPSAAPAALNTGRSALLQISAVIGLLIVLGAAGVGLRRYRRRRALAATSLTSPPAVSDHHQKAEL